MITMVSQASVVGYPPILPYHASLMQYQEEDRQLVGHPPILPCVPCVMHPHPPHQDGGPSQIHMPVKAGTDGKQRSNSVITLDMGTRTGTGMGTGVDTGMSDAGCQQGCLTSLLLAVVEGSEADASADAGVKGESSCCCL